MEDWQLLDTYARTGSEAAFAQLVERHLGLVHAAARRQVNNDALAADVAQAVFLLLARKAGSFGPKLVLAGWLFRTTRFIATRALRAEIRRQRREQEALAMQQLQAADPQAHWSQIAPELDEALARLGETDRNALLLRFAEGRNHREVGLALGLNEEAAKKRVNRALEKLRSLLAHHGVTLTVALLAGQLADRLSAAPPAGLAASITEGVVAGGAPAGVAAGLAQQAVEAWRRTQRIWTAALVGGAALVAAFVFALLSPKETAANPTPATNLASTDSPAMAQTAGVPPRLNGTETFRLRVVAADTGLPLPGARVLLNFVSNGQWIAPNDLETDAHGECLIPLPRGTLMRLDAGAHFQDYENRFFTWRSDWQHPRPESYTLTLGRAETMGGQVVDEQGRPLGGVTVWLQYGAGDTSWREPEEDRERLGFVRRFRLATTDDQGRWLCSTIPMARVQFYFEFEHPDYVKTSIVVGRDDYSAVGRERLAGLRSRTIVTPLQLGTVAFGQVVNEHGEPISGARIGTSWHQPGAFTDSEGQFSMRSQPRGEVMYIATAEGYAPRKFRVQAGGAAARVQLDPGSVLRARLVNPQGEPIPGATLVLEDGVGDSTLGWNGQTDDDGRVTWRSAPPDRTFTFTAYAPGYRYRRQFPLLVDPNVEHTVTLEPSFLVTGRVVDADNGQPIERFKAIPGQGRDHPNMNRSGLFYGTNGIYQLRISEAGEPVVQLEAEGYETEVGYPEPGPNGETRCDFQLRRADSQGAVRGVVLNPDGSPAPGAEVALCTLEKSAQLGHQRLVMGTDSIVTNTDSRGRFVFPVVQSPHTVAAVSTKGFNLASVRSNAPVEIRLQPFGAIEGILLLDGQPQAEKRIQLVDPNLRLYWGAFSLDFAAFQAQTDSQGRFRIDHVPAGDFLLFLNLGVGIPYTEETKVRVSAGELSQVVMGVPNPAGRPVVGRLKPSEAISVTDWRQHIATRSLSRTLPVVEPPTGLSEEARKMWWVVWYQSPAGLEQTRQNANYTVVVEADGRFTVRGVPPGEYQLQLTALPTEMARKGEWNFNAAEWYGLTLQNVIIPEPNPNDSATSAPLDLGDVELKIQRRQL